MKKHFFGLLSLVILLTTADHVWGQSDTLRLVSLDEALQLAIKQNPTKADQLY
jgi:hypothetical protein